MIRIRPLEPRDLPALAQLYTHYATHSVTTYYQGEASEAYMRSLFTGRGHACAVAVDETDGAVGYVHISPTIGLHRPCTMAVYVQYERTHQSIGPQLVCHGERLAREMGYQQMRVSICSENAPSIAMFEKLRYVRTGIKRDDAFKFGRSLDTLYYAKNLMEDAT